MRGPIAELLGGPYVLVVILVASLIFLLFVRPQTPKTAAQQLPVHRVSRVLRYALGEEEFFDVKDVRWLVDKSGTSLRRARGWLGIVKLYSALLSLTPSGRRWLVRWATRRG
ncbi:MAG: hypothetical protein NZ957_04120 [Thaumarchaeota archaeon]|nr:hypothetical protein [Candidatus Calditenuaceae archaeon]